MADISNNYWIVGGDATRYWSSKSVQYVPSNDTTFLAWLSLGNAPTAVPDEGTLIAALDATYPQGWPGGDAELILAMGIAITSTGTPALNGTYALNSPARQDIVHIVTGINASSNFPGGASTFVYRDIANGSHTFPNTTAFINFAVACRNYYFGVRAVSRTLRAGGSGTYPTNAVTIA